VPRLLVSVTTGDGMATADTTGAGAEIGQPQDGQLAALSETVVEHSGQLIRAMRVPENDQ